MDLAGKYWWKVFLSLCAHKDAFGKSGHIFFIIIIIVALQHLDSTTKIKLEYNMMRCWRSTSNAC